MGLCWCNKAKILGVYLRSKNTEESIYLDNFQPMIGKMQAILNSWVKSSLMIKGKVTVVNALNISLLTYVTSVIPTPKRLINKFKDMIVSYLWKGRKTKMVIDFLYKDIEQGGLKLADLPTRIKASNIQWVKS